MWKCLHFDLIDKLETIQIPTTTFSHLIIPIVNSYSIVVRYARPTPQPPLEKWATFVFQDFLLTPGRDWTLYKQIPIYAPSNDNKSYISVGDGELISLPSSVPGILWRKLPHHPFKHSEKVLAQQNSWFNSNPFSWNRGVISLNKYNKKWTRNKNYYNRKGNLKTV